MPGWSKLPVTVLCVPYTYNESSVYQFTEQQDYSSRESLCFPGYDPHRNSDFLSDFLLILLIHPPWEPEVERKLIR